MENGFEPFIMHGAEVERRLRVMRELKDLLDGRIGERLWSKFWCRSYITTIYKLF